MKVPIFRAKDIDSNDIVEGFYSCYPRIAGNNLDNDVLMSNTCHCIITHMPSAMGVINEPVGCNIDITTLEFVKFIDVPCKSNQIILT